MLTRLTNAVIVGSTLTWLTGCDSLSSLYPGAANNQFGGVIILGKKTDFSPANPARAKLNQAGVFHLPNARTYLIHLPKTTEFLLTGVALKDRLASESVLVDTDGSYWIALYQRCTHLGCTVPFRDDCASFKCPCHGSHYNVTGEYLAGPAPRSLDRFPLSFHGEEVQADTGRLNNNVTYPENSTRLIPVPKVSCP